MLVTIGTQRVKRESTVNKFFKTIFPDEDCPEEDVGVLKCRDNPTPTTALPTTVLPTTTTSSSSSSSSFMSSTITPTSITTQAPCTQAAHTSTASTVEAGSVSEQTSVTESKQSTPTEPVKCPLPPRNNAQVGDNHMERGVKVNKCSNGSLFDFYFRRLSFFFGK